MNILKVNDYRDLKIDLLIEDSVAQGYRFLIKLEKDYRDGVTCFDKPNEVLLKIVDAKGSVIAIGGVCADPYQHKCGRIRRFYVHASQRNKGYGRELIHALLAFAKDYYPIINVRVPENNSKAASAFYESQGFVAVSSTDKSHEFIIVHD